MKGQGFPAAARLRKKSEFLAVKENGKRLAGRLIVLNYSRTEQTPSPRLGIITTRNTGTAVRRSRARRLIREAFRKHQGALEPGTHLVVIARNSINGRTAREVEEEWLKLCHKAGLIRTPSP